jgi:hypothetical protein
MNLSPTESGFINETDVTKTGVKLVQSNENGRNSALGHVTVNGGASTSGEPPKRTSSIYSILPRSASSILREFSNE